jgi:nicotinamidase-related amidase
MRGGFQQAYNNSGAIINKYSIGGKKNHSLWTDYFAKHAAGSGVIIPNIPSSQNRYLYVIDMQNDFIDRNYSDGMGKFPVGEGTSVIPDIVKYIKPDIYTEIIFSRDYHPSEHCSFGIDSDVPLDTKGSFPRHCVQGTEGAQLINEIKDGFNNGWKDLDNVKVIFKGIKSTADSFSAMPFKKARQVSSGPFCSGCTDEVACSNVTGGWYLTKDGSTYANETWDYNGAITYNETVTANGYTPVKYTPNFPDGSVIEVCGLAGDYCVRDTAIALGNTYPNCRIVVLNDLVRYPFLPMWLGCIMHTNTGSAPETHLEHLEYFLNTEADKGFNYYLFNGDKLMKPSEISMAFPDVETLKARIGSDVPNYGGGVLNHFLSDPRDIIKDYTAANVKMLLASPQAGGKRKSTRKRKNRKSKKTRKGRK